MPTYEYSCKKCGEHLEVVQSFKDDALTECPNCGGVLRKVFGNIGIAFKGSGFYRNDSRQGHSTAKPAASATGTASETAASSGGGATKPAPTTTPAAEKSPAPSAPAAAAS
jgi:putative FmdB family regulatory protein